MNSCILYKNQYIYALTLLLVASVTFGQISTFPWFEDFGDPTCALPAGFTNYGSDPWDFQNTSETYMEGTDHTTGSGCFASMDDSGGASEDSCILETPAFDLTSIPNARCSFWWQNSNSTTSQAATSGPRTWSGLEVDVSTDSGATWTTNVFTVVDSQQIGWAYAEIDLSSYNSTETMIRFRGRETYSFYSDLSLDDITIFEPATLDAGISAVGGLDGICPGTVNVTADIVNEGLTTITSVDVNWSVNGVLQTPFSYTGSINYLGSDQISLGSFTAASSTSYDVLVWTSNPNSGVDNNNSNDTLSSLNIETGLAGSYTVGATGDFATIADVVNELNTSGICAAVTFNVSTATYTGQIAIGEIVGSSATNTITFNGNGATISDAPSSTDRYIVLLDGADYITLDSFNIVSTDPTYGYGVLLTNEANYNTINACTIDLTAVTSTSSVNSIGIGASGSTTSLTTAGNNANFCNFTNNTILGGTTGVYYGIRLNGNSGGLDCVGNQIIGNTIQDIYAYNIYLYNTDSNLVSQNDISRPTKTTVSTFYGVFLTGGLNNLIERNRIHNTHDAATSLTGATYTIYFSAADAPSGKPNVAFNNLIYNLNSDGTIYTIYNSSSDGAYYLYNTISLDNVSATGGTTRGVYQTTTASDIIVANNIFSITRGGSGVKHGLYFNTNTSSIISDNNIIYMNSVGTGAQNTGRWDGTDHTSFLSWQGANSNAFDQASDSANPEFLNLASNDLTPSTVTGNNIGFPIPDIPTDFFGTLRDVIAPDPGAIEFIAIHSNDICDSATTVTAGTYGGSTVDASSDNAPTCVVGDDLEGGVWYKYTASNGFVTTSLCGSNYDTRIRVFSGTCSSLICETGNEDSCGTQSMAGWCSEDTTDYYILVYGNGETGSFELEITETPAPTPTVTALTDTAFCTGDSAVLESSEATSYLWSDVGSTSSRTLILYTSDTVMVTTTDTNGCMRISDPQIVSENPLPVVNLGADTTICEDGSITLDAGPGASFDWNTGQTGQMISYHGSNGDTTISVSVTDTEGCMGSDEITISVEDCYIGIPEFGNQTVFNLYPNPNNGQFIVSFNESNDNQLSMKVLDMQGKAVFSEQFYMNSNQVKQMDLSSLPKGFYTLVVQDESSVQSQKLIIR